MVSSTPIGQPAPEHKITLEDGWSVEVLENGNGYAFVTPKGYRFVFANYAHALNFIIEYQYDGIYHSTKHGDKHYSEGYDLAVWTVDPWINKDWNHGDVVCRKQELTAMILDYAYLKWMKNS